MSDSDLIARARELGAPMLAPEAGIARRSELLFKLADRVEALERLLREVEWAAIACPVCRERRATYPIHAPGCRLARAIGKEASDG